MMLSQFLSTNGDGTGTVNAVGDYSSASDSFYIQPPTNQNYSIARMIIQIQDGTGLLNAGGYGAAAALTNGITVQTKIKQVRGVSGVQTTVLNSTLTVKTNADWGRVCYDVQEVAFGTGDNYVSVRWTFAKSGKPIILRGDRGDLLEVVVNDNLTVLDGHYFLVQGQSFITN